MPLVKLPHPSLERPTTGSRRIVDPRQFWENVQYLARMINGGLGIENIDALIGLAYLERTKSSFSLYFDVDTSLAFCPALAVEPLFTSQDSGMKTQSIEVIGASEDFAANAYVGGTAVANIGVLDGQPEYVIDCVFPMDVGDEFGILITAGTCLGVVVTVDVGHQ